MAKIRPQKSQNNDAGDLCLLCGARKRYMTVDIPKYYSFEICKTCSLLIHAALLLKLAEEDSNRILALISEENDVQNYEDLDK